MLFLLHYQHETESNIDNTDEFDSKGTPEQIQDDVHMSDLEDKPVYKGPQTWSRTKDFVQKCAKVIPLENLHRML